MECTLYFLCKIANRKKRKSTSRNHLFSCAKWRSEGSKVAKSDPKPLRFPLREEGGIAKSKCMSLTVVFEHFWGRTFALLGGANTRTDRRTDGQRSLPGRAGRGRAGEGGTGRWRRQSKKYPVHGRLSPPFTPI